jgi:chromosome segregation ATPase
MRDAEMARKVGRLRFLAVLACALVLLGREDTEKEKALAEAEQAKLSLAKAEIQLARAEREIADLKEELDAVKGARDELDLQIGKHF